MAQLQSALDAQAAELAATPQPLEPQRNPVWTADQTIRWIPAGGVPRNDAGATIVGDAYDPHGLLPVAAANPGAPVFPLGFQWKTKRAQRTGFPANAIWVKDGAVVGVGNKPRVRISASAVPHAPVAPLLLDEEQDEDLTQERIVAWVSAHRTIARELAEILRDGAKNGHMYRDTLAMGGIVPPRETRARK